MENGGRKHVTRVPRGLPPEKTTFDKNDKTWLALKHRVVSYSKEKLELPLSFVQVVAN